MSVQSKILNVSLLFIILGESESQGPEILGIPNKIKGSKELNTQSISLRNTQIKDSRNAYFF